MEWDSNWISAISTAISAVMTIVSAGIAYTAKKIADKQNDSSRLQVNLGLYEKRYKVYDNAKRFMSEVVTSGVEFKKVQEFQKETVEARFLFRKDICEYLDTIINNNEKINKLNEKLGYAKLSEGEEKSSRDEISKIKSWFNEQFTTKLNEKFSDYLDFTNVNVQRK